MPHNKTIRTMFANHSEISSNFKKTSIITIIKILETTKIMMFNV